MDLNALKKKLYTGDILDYSIEIFKNNFKKFALLVLVFHVPVSFLLGFLSGNVNMYLQMLKPGNEYAALTNMALYQFSVSLGSLYEFVLLNVLVVAVISLSYNIITYNRPVKTRELLKTGFSRFGSLILVNLALLGIVMVAGFILFLLVMIITMTSTLMLYEGTSIIIPVLVSALTVIAALIAIGYIYTRLSLAAAAISIDGISAGKAIKLSLKMTKKRFWKTFLPYFFGFILVGFFGDLATVAVSFIPFESVILTRILFGLTMALSAFLAPFQYIVQTILYTKYKTDSGELEFQLELDKMMSAG